jgi:hypothetical protein
MHTHLGCTGQVELGALGKDTQQRLERVEATWLEFSVQPPALVVRHVQPDDKPALREIAGELLDFLGKIPEAERAAIPGGALYCEDEQNGQYVRLKVAKGGQVTVAWANPDYSRGNWTPFSNQPILVVFEPYQRINGQVRFDGSPNAADNLRKLLESTAGLYAQGDYQISTSVDHTEVTLRDVNADVLSLVNALRYLAKPGTLEGEIDLSSFRTGDLEGYCRFVLKRDEIWLVRPSLWGDAPEPDAQHAKPLAQVA